jgi:hypothetical protein
MANNSLAGAVPTPASTRTGASYLDATIYIFNSLYRPETGRKIPLRQALELIKSSDYIQLIRQARQFGKGSSEYKQIKEKQVPCFVSNVSDLEGNYRDKKYIKQFSGLMFFDIDTAGVTIEDIAVIPELVCCYQSFGGLGFGLLVAVEGLTAENYLSTWQHLRARYAGYGLEIDKVASDPARPNVLSYSEVLLADEVTPFQAVAPLILPKPERKAITGETLPAATAFERIKKALDNKGVYFGKGSRNAYVFALATRCNSAGIPQDQALAWITEEFTETGFTGTEIQQAVASGYKDVAAFGSYPFIIEDYTPLSGPYNKSIQQPEKPRVCAPVAVSEGVFCLTFSAKSLKKETPESETPAPITEYVLGPGQKLSDLNLDLTKSQAIDSPTASGKTAAFALSDLCYDMLVPTQDQAKQVGTEYHIDYVIEGLQPTEAAQQVGTYNASEKFIQRDTAHRTLVIDESQNTALEQGFRADILNNMLDQAPKYNNVVLLSGTPVKSCHPVLKALPVTRVRNKEQQRKAWKVITYTDRNAALIERLERGKLQTVVLQHKEKSKELAALLKGKGYKVQCFNADTKHEAHHREIIEQCTVNDGVDVLIVTGLFFVGLNIYNLNVGAVHLLSRLSRYHIEQLFKRYRKAQPEILYQYRPATADLYQDVTFDWDTTQDRLLKAAEYQVKNLELMPTDVSEDTKLADRILRNLQGEHKHLVRFTTTWQINYLGVDYLTVQQEKQAMHQSLPLMEKLLRIYGFEFAGIEAETAADPQLKAQAKEVAEACKKAQQQRVTEIMQAFEYGGMSYVMQAADSWDTVEAETAGRVLQLTKYVPFETAMCLLAVPLSDKKYSLLLNQVIAQKYLQARKGSKADTPETRMLDTLYRLFEVGEALTPLEVLNRLKRVKNRHFRTQHMSLTENKSVRILNQFFELKRSKRCSATEPNKRENCYLIMSTNPLQIDVTQAQGIAA